MVEKRSQAQQITVLLRARLLATMPGTRQRRSTPIANPEHIEQLKQDIAEWNVWREENPWVQPDFSGAELHSANFSEAS